MENIKQKMTIEDLAIKMDSGLSSLEKKMGSGFINLEKKMDERFDGVGQEFVRVYERFEKVESTVEHGLAEVNSRLTSVEKRLWQFELMS